MKRCQFIIALVCAACMVCTLVSYAWAVDDKAPHAAPAVPKPPKPTKVTVVHGDHEIPHAVTVQAESVTVARLMRDSIYAHKISIDMGGIRIVDRNGVEFVLPVHPRVPGTAPQIVDIPDEPEYNIVIEEGDDTIFIERDEQPDQVTQVASDIEVRSDEVVRGDVVCIFCDVKVSGTVTGSAVSVFGNVDVDGRVGNEAVAPFGRIRVGPNGHVSSDAVASRILRDPGGRIDGSREEIFLNIFGGDDGLSESWTRQTFTIIVILKILFWLFLVLLAHALAARNIVKVKERIQKSYVKSFLIGVLGQILLIPVFLLLLVTIIGIPVALFVLPLMLFGGLVLAQAAVGQLVGDKIAENTSMPLHTSLSRTIFGVAALQVFAYLTIIFIWPAGGPAGGAFRLVTLIMFGLSAIMGYVVMTLGTGAVIQTRFGTRPKEVAPALDGTLTQTPPITGDAIPATPLPFEPHHPGDEDAAPAPLS